MVSNWKHSRLAFLMWLFLLAAPAAISQSSQQGAMTLDHVAIYVADLKTSVAFYKDVFGLEQIPMPVPIAAWLSTGHGTALHIVAGRKERVSNSKWEHLSFACDSMDEMIARLEAKHIAWASMQGKKEPYVRFDGVKQIFIQDPDGYWIEINDANRKH